MLARLLSQLESTSAAQGNSVKCVPSYVAPDLASAIRRHVAQSLRQRKGNFPCYYLLEWATYTLPAGLWNNSLSRDTDKVQYESGNSTRLSRNTISN